MTFKALSKTIAFAFSLALFTSPLVAEQVSGIQIKIEGNAAKQVIPELVSDCSSKAIELVEHEGVYYAKDLVDGDYTLSLVSKYTDKVILVDSITWTQSETQESTEIKRDIECSHQTSGIVCLHLM